MSQHAFSFATATEIRFGRGASSGVADAVAGMSDSVLLVHGSRSASAGWLAEAMEAKGVNVARFACPKEPDIVLVEAGVAAARESGAKAVVALGGGAVMDCGKAIAALVPATRPLFDHLEVVGKGLPLDAAPLPFIAVPTTAGTGAEATKNAVIAIPDARRKVSLRDNRMLARLAVVDPTLTDGCPKSVTLASGLDAVTQVIEPYVSTRANPMTDALTAPAIPAGLAALRRLMAGEDADARDTMAWVSLCGGLALANGGLGAVHGLAGPIGGVAPAPHGAVCGVLLPFVLAANLERADALASERLGQVRHWIAEAFGVPDEQAFATLAAWSHANGLPGLAAMGVRREQFAEVAAASHASSSMKGNPVALDDAALVAVMEAAA